MIFTHIGEYGSFHLCVSERRSSLILGSTEVFICVFQRDDLHSIGEHGSFHVYVSERQSSLILGSMEVFICVFQRDDLHSYWGVWKFSFVCFREMIFTHIGEYGSFHLCVSERRSLLILGSMEVFICVFQRDDLHSIGEHGSFHVYVSEKRSSLYRGVWKFSCLCFREMIFTHIGEYGSFHVYVSERRSSLILGSMEVFICVFQRDDLHSYWGARKFSCLYFR